MTGELIESRPGGGGAAWVFFPLATACLIAAALTPSIHWAVAAILPLALGIAAVINFEPRVAFRVTDEGLAFESPESVFVRFDEIRGLTARNKADNDQFSMQLYHDGGVIRLPTRLTVSSRQLYRFLLAQLPDALADGAVGLTPGLRSFVSTQVELFGADRVYVFQARPHKPISSYQRHVAFSMAVLLAGVAWIAAGVVFQSVRLDGGPWIGVGFAALFVGGLCAFGFSRQSGSGRPKNWADSCLVVSPGGIALVQGTLQGKMRWDELRAVEYPAKPRFGMTAAGHARGGVGLLVEGAYLIIADFYNRPLDVIHYHLRKYWGGAEVS